MPFTSLQLFDTKACTCCPAYIDKSYVRPTGSSGLWRVWNDDKIQELRTKILNGDYSACQNCPRFYKNKIADRCRPLEWKASMDIGPSTIMMCIDNSCNLKCPSCRKGMIVANGDQVAKRVQYMMGFMPQCISNLKLLDIAGDGEPFFSKVYTYLFDWLESRIDKYPRLKLRIRTNGLLLPQKWGRWPRTMARVRHLNLSLDGSTKKTYEAMRLGGSFERILKCLDFVKALRKSSNIKDLVAIFVVQAGNYHEMGDFVDFTKKYNVDRINFLRLNKIGQSDDGWALRRISDPNHPENDKYLKMLKDPRLQDRIVELQ